jgi:hypothetical protein
VASGFDDELMIAVDGDWEGHLHIARGIFYVTRSFSKPNSAA